MNIEEFTADRQAKMKRVDDLRKQVEVDKAELQELELVYNTALIEGNDSEADKLFPELTSLKDKIKSSSYKADKLEFLNAEAIHKNAEETFLHLKSIQAEYEKKAKKLDDEMKPIEEKALKLLHKSDELVNEYREVTQEYFRLADNYKVSTTNKGLSRYSSLDVFKETGVRVNGYGVVAEKDSGRPTGSNQSNDHTEESTISDFAKSNRLIGGK
ncbi:hypothetical protein [Carnobacterium mobile]|uniref:hypothetical protein n=1 Tax=Carnobacterium mobile TaxID=2750 RepID=UPI0005560481|nr:hypothetical protein [Carnobacterium mobile]